ncbi:MAG TPA: DUF1552 domain-containing protein [Polyangiaceae bacterium]
MRSYRFARRSFLAGIGGAFGLKIMLDNLEAMAAGAVSPPRFLMTHWPVGTIRTQWVPTGSGSTYVTSPILEPFETAGLREDMVVLYGLSHGGISAGSGGGHEAGTPMMATGANCPGTRRNGGEADDACAGGPSWDQIFLRRIPELVRPGQGYANAICDARIDSYETSTRCISYGYTTRSIVAERPTAGAMITEAVPLYPTLSPLALYTAIFQGFVPGGSMTDEAALRALRARKSVLDYAMSELAEVRLLCPASERTKIDAHAEAIRKIEMQLAEQIANPPGENSCALPVAPDADLTGKTADRLSDYTDPTTSTDDSDIHRAVGKAHWGIIKAAFQCDLIRVATFQWSPGTNHVSFRGLDPNSPNTIYMHHPLSHKVQDPSFYNGSRPSSNAYVWDAMVNANKWYNTETAALLAELKSATDIYGGSLLDHTIVPHVTEVAEASHTRSPLPALIFGGKELGMQGGQFQNFSQNRSHNSLWVSIAQAYLNSDDPLNPDSPLAEDNFVKQNVAPIDGLWAPPA